MSLNKRKKITRACRECETMCILPERRSLCIWARNGKKCSCYCETCDPEEAREDSCDYCMRSVAQGHYAKCGNRWDCPNEYYNLCISCVRQCTSCEKFFCKTCIDHCIFCKRLVCTRVQAYVENCRGDAHGCGHTVCCHCRRKCVLCKLFYCYKSSTLSTTQSDCIRKGSDDRYYCYECVPAQE